MAARRRGVAASEDPRGGRGHDQVPVAGTMTIAFVGTISGVGVGGVLTDYSVPRSSFHASTKTRPVSIVLRSLSLLSPLRFSFSSMLVLAFHAD